jgi:hypothetical protein
MRQVESGLQSKSKLGLHEAHPSAGVTLSNWLAENLAASGQFDY